MRPDDLTQSLPLAACPVPPEQLPLNEYDDLRQSWFFRWATLDLHLYLRKFLWVWIWGFAIAAPVAAASFPLAKQPLQFGLASAGGAMLFVVLALVRLYLGWAYVSSRLANATVIYEESGWYDGQMWPKPAAVLMRDRLVVSYQIHPLLKRMQATFGGIAAILLFGVILWNVF